MSMCRVFSCVVGRGHLVWPVHSLDKTLSAFALLHFVLQGYSSAFDGEWQKAIHELCRRRYLTRKQIQWLIYAASWSSGQVAPNYASITYGLVWIQFTWKLVGARRLLWASCLSPWKQKKKEINTLLLYSSKGRKTSLLPETGNSWQRILYEQTLIFLY